MGFRMTNNRCEEIKKIVVNTFTEYGIKCVPISGFEMATKLGAKIIPYSSFSVEKQKLLFKRSDDGFSVEKDDGEWFIYYNDTKGYGRINYTIMHENAHIILNHSQESELADVEANFFAKYALAPPALIHELGLENPSEIANKFDISLEAALYALKYYRKWLQYGENDYTDYELKLLNLFEEAI